MELHNTSSLDSLRLYELFTRHAEGWPTAGLRVFVRHSRGAPFSGLCAYREARVHVNVGRGVRFPFELRTYVARAVTRRGAWWRPVYVLDVPDAYLLALFVFMHELYHALVYKAGRNPRQKESRCDRFAVRALVDHHRLRVRDAAGRPVPRDEWDFQDLDAFVAQAGGRTALSRPRGAGA